MEEEKTVLDKTFSVFAENLRTPAIYVQSQENKVEEFKTLTKLLYDNTRGNLTAFSSTKPQSLSKLITKGFDEEQVWQQLELENNFILPTFIDKISNINTTDVTLGINVSGPQTSFHNKRDNIDHKTADDYESSSDESETEYVFDGDSDSSMDPSHEGFVFDGDSDSSTELPLKRPAAGKESLEPDEESELDMESAELDKELPETDEESPETDEESPEPNENKIVKMKKKSIRSKPSVVDDHFFKLSQLENFLKVEDLKEERGENIGLGDINLFEEIPSDDDEDENEGDDEDDNEGDDEEEDEEGDFDNEDDSDGKENEDVDENEIDETENGVNKIGNFFKDVWKKKNKSSRDLMYQDFFDPPESGEESIDEEELLGDERNETSNKNDDDFYEDEDSTANQFDEHSEAKDPDSEDVPNLEGSNNHMDTIAEEEEECVNEVVDTLVEKTPFEIEQDQIKKQIYECEKRLLRPLPWQLSGEVDAKKRPANSLLHLETEIDMNAKPDLIIDDALNEKTENIIKMAIVNKAWHDVVRKVKSLDDMAAFKKQTDLEMTKSKKGLAEVYEEDYLKQKGHIEEEEDPKHIEIKKLMDALIPELHAMFTHIPKPPVPDIKVVSNLPAITVEDVAPTTMTDAHLLAPQEVKKSVGLLKGSSERTATDKKRERRKKKVHQKIKYKEIELKAISGGKLTAEEKLVDNMQVLKKLQQHRNTKILEPTTKLVKSSKEFFSHLQDTIDKKRPRTAEADHKSKKVKRK